MKKSFFKITLILFGCLATTNLLKSQDVGATFCWHYEEIYGGHAYAYNQSIAKKGLPNDNTHWSSTTEWWENMVEEIDYSGIDFIALLSRGDQPNAPDRGNGNPAHISKLVTAMTTRGINSFKLAIFDDCPNSWTGSKNWDTSGGTSYSTDSPKFDCSNSANYKYIWDYNLKIAIGAIPDAKRYKIDGRMVIFFWSAKPAWMTNLQGNLSKILTYIKNQCQATYGFKPYCIIDKDWLDNDNTLSTSTVDGVHGWFSAAGGVSYTLETWNGKKFGALCPGFGKPTETTAFLDPSMGTTDNGKRLKTGLTNTVDAGARTTLVEGFTDAAEAAALWRSTDEGQLSYYDYANQRLNILRRYTSDPYPATLKVEAEACDTHNDLTTGNSAGAFLDRGNLDVEKCADINSGWNVTNTQANEWMEWKELPILANTKFQLRYKSTSASSIKFSVDGTSLSTINLPSTNDAWTTVDAGNYTTASNSLHTVRLTILSGTPEINFFQRVNGTVAVTSVSLTPASISIIDGNTQQLTSTISPSNATNKTVTWSSSNTAVASVSSSGLVTAQSPGSATITAMTQDGGKSDVCAVTVTAASVGMQVLQAENGTVSGAVVATNQAGYYGTGFVDFTNATGDYLQWTVNVPLAGTYDLSFRYALPSGGRPLELKINGTVKNSSLDFPATGLWDSWEKVVTSQLLNAGNNTVRLTTNGSNGGNIDELVIIPFVDECDVLAGWSSASANSISYYTTDKKQGAGSLQMVGSATEEFKKVFSPAFNSNVTIANGALRFWYYVSDVTKCGIPRVELGSGGAADVDELSWPLNGLVNGWNLVALNLSDATQTGTPNLKAIDWFRIYDTKTASITTRIDALQLVEIATLNRSAKIEEEVANISQKSVNISPNPYHSGALKLHLLGFDKSEKIKVSITNVSGKLICFETIVADKVALIDVPKQISTGIYFITLETIDSKIVTKLIKK